MALADVDYEQADRIVRPHRIGGCVYFMGRVWPDKELLSYMGSVVRVHSVGFEDVEVHHRDRHYSRKHHKMVWATGSRICYISWMKAEEKKSKGGEWWKT